MHTGRYQQYLQLISMDSSCDYFSENLYTRITNIDILSTLVQ